LLALFGVVFQFAAALPAAELDKRDIFVPPVLDPHAGTVWLRGERRNVTWDISDPPVNITNKFGQIRLRKGELTTPLILADGFDILLGSIEVTVPWVEEGTDYSILLLGDSGNFGQQFTIK
ncbi:hypothetical protein C8Q78DRAFT_932206, partial [Trametes maxima]